MITSHFPTIPKLWLGSLIWVYFISANLTAQNRTEYLNFESLNQGGNLKSQSISRIVQDKRGFVWFASLEGLIRYDGYDFKEFTYNANDESSIKAQYVTDMQEDKKGRLWISDAASGELDVFDPDDEKFIHYKKNNPNLNIPDKGISKIYFDSKENVWLGFSSQFRSPHDLKALMKFNPSTGFQEKYDYPDSTISRIVINDIIEDKKGNIWFSGGDGLFKIIKNKLEKIQPGGGYKILFDKRETFWISSQDSLIQFDIENNSVKRFWIPNDNEILNIEWKNDSEIWISTGENLVLFNTKTLTYSKVLNSFGKDIESHYVYTDKQGNTFAAHREGVSVLRKSSSKFEFVKINLFVRGKVSPNYTPRIKRIHENRATRELFFAALVDTIYSFNLSKKRLNTFLPKEFEGNSFVSDIIYDLDSNTWVITENYIYKFDPRYKKLEKLELQIIKPNFYTAVFDKNGSLWVGSWTNGLYKIDINRNTFESFNVNSTPSIPNQIRKALRDIKGKLWFGTYDGLLVVDPSNNRFDLLRNDPAILTSLNASLITELAIGESGVIYIGTNVGLNIHFPEDSINKYKRVDADDNFFLSICEERENVIWYVTTNAVCRYNIKLRTTERFDKSHGLLGAIRNMTVCKLRDTILVGSRGGFYAYNLHDTIDSVNVLFPINITSFKIDGRDRNFSNERTKKGSLIIEPEENAIQFVFSSMDYTEPSRVRYYYKLERYDKDWIEVDKNRTAIFSNLKEGKYNLQVYYEIINSVKSKTLTIPIVVKVPFFETKIFLIAGVLFSFSLIIMAFIYLRIKYDKDRKSNERIAELQLSALRAQINPHFLFNSLNSINRYILANDSVLANSYLSKFSKLIRSILENVSVTYISIDEEIALLTKFIELEQMRLDNKFKYVIEIDPGIDTDSEMVPTMIVQPYVENSIWHGISPMNSQGLLKIVISKIKGRIQIIVEDNGVGRKKTIEPGERKYKKSLGHKITEERLSVMNSLYKQQASVDIIDLQDDNGVPCGTRVVIRLA